MANSDNPPHDDLFNSNMSISLASAGAIIVHERQVTDLETSEQCEQEICIEEISV